MRTLILLCCISVTINCRVIIRLTFFLLLQQAAMFWISSCCLNPQTKPRDLRWLCSPECSSAGGPCCGADKAVIIASRPYPVYEGGRGRLYLRDCEEDLVWILFSSCLEIQAVRQWKCVRTDRVCGLRSKMCSVRLCVQNVSSVSATGRAR